MKDVRELIRELGAAGTTVFLSSHLLHEVEQVCTRAVIINRGRVVVQGPVSELRPAERRDQGAHRRPGPRRRGAARPVRRRRRRRGRGLPRRRADEDAVPELVRAPGRRTASRCAPWCRRRSRASRTSSSSSPTTPASRRAARRGAGLARLLPEAGDEPPCSRPGARRRAPESAPPGLRPGARRATAAPRARACAATRWGPLRAASGSSSSSSAAATSSGAARSLIPFLIALAFYLTRDNPESGGGRPVLLERITSNGMFVTLAALSVAASPSCCRWPRPWSPAT